MKFKEREAEVIKKYSNAKEIYLLLRERKLNKKEILFDWLVLFFTPLTSIVAEADMLSDLGTYYLVVEGNKYLLVRAEKKEITEKDITNICNPMEGKKFIVEKNRFKKVKKVYG